MAKRNDMSTARRSRNRRHTTVAQSGASTLTRSSPETEAISPTAPKAADTAEIIRNERDRLRGAQAVLDCVAFALLYEDWLEEPNRPSFADAVAAVGGIIGETVEHFSSA